MKVEINESRKVKEREFPKLMVGKLGSIVLFSSKRKGVLLDTEKSNGSLIRIGDYYDEWNMSSFTDFEGSITLSND